MRSSSGRKFSQGKWNREKCDAAVVELVNADEQNQREREREQASSFGFGFDSDFDSIALATNTAANTTIISTHPFHSFAGFKPELLPVDDTNPPYLLANGERAADLTRDIISFISTASHHRLGWRCEDELRENFNCMTERPAGGRARNFLRRKRRGDNRRADEWRATTSVAAAVSTCCSPRARCSPGIFPQVDGGQVSRP